MKEQHIEGHRTNARAILIACNIGLDQDFHTLRMAQVDSLLAYADQAKYHKPKAAKGSRGRYFLQLLQRRAK